MLDRAGMPYDEKQKEPLKPRKRKRDTISFRLLPETKEMLDRAASETDMTLGRYIEKALRAQFRKDGIVPAKQLEKMEQVLLYKSLVETELAKGKQVELSVLIDGELYALRRRDTIREQDKTIKSARKLRGARDYKLVHIAKAFERTVVYVGLSKSPRLAAELAWDPKPKASHRSWPPLRARAGPEHSPIAVMELDPHAR